LAIQSLNLSY